MNWFPPLFGIAIALFDQEALAKNRLTDPVKIARECKGDLELLCKGLRPGRHRVISCLKEKVTESSPAARPQSSQRNNRGRCCGITKEQTDVDPDYVNRRSNLALTHI